MTKVYTAVAYCERIICKGIKTLNCFIFIMISLHELLLNQTEACLKRVRTVTEVYGQIRTLYTETHMPTYIPIPNLTLNHNLIFDFKQYAEHYLVDFPAMNSRIQPLKISWYFFIYFFDCGLTSR